MKYRKRPVVIEACVWEPNEEGLNKRGWPRSHSKCRKFEVSALTLNLFIPTLEGEMQASPGDYIIKGVHGEFYPCKPDIFAKTYEGVIDE